MPSNEELDYIINFAKPLPGRREDCRQFLRQVIKLIRERADHLADKDPEFLLPAWKLRRSLKQLSKTLSKANKQVRALGPYNNMLGSSLGEKLNIEREKRPSDLADYLELCVRIVDDSAGRVVTGRGDHQRNTTAALAEMYASTILERFGTEQISSTDDGTLSNLAAEIFQLVAGKEMDLGRYLRRGVRFHKEQPKNSGK